MYTEFLLRQEGNFGTFGNMEWTKAVLILGNAYD